MDRLETGGSEMRRESERQRDRGSEYGRRSCGFGLACAEWLARSLAQCLCQVRRGAQWPARIIIIFLSSARPSAAERARLT